MTALASKASAHWRWIWTSLAILILMIAWVGPEVRAQEPSTEDSYFSFEGEVPVTIALDRIGIVPAQGVTADSVETFADERGFEILLRPDSLRSIGLDGDYYILGVEQRTRSELVAFARDLRQTEPVVGQAGLVVTPEGSKVPMVLTDQFVADFGEGVSRAEIDSINTAHGVEILREDPIEENTFLLTVTGESERDALEMANFYHQEVPTEFGEPNFVVAHELRKAVPGDSLRPKQTIPNDPFFNNQWHHRNTGQNGGASDADLDTPQAWNITTGDPSTVIAVIDNGFDVDAPNPHPDLNPNLWDNPNESANNSDDDGDRRADDLHGWDFSGCSTSSGPGCGDETLAGGRHGTSTAGAAAAEGDNSIGVSGTCPDCRLMLLRQGGTFWADRLAFRYAQQENADIISNTVLLRRAVQRRWGLTTLRGLLIPSFPA